MASFFIRTKRKQLFSNWDGTKHRRHGKNNRDHFLLNATSCLSGALRLTFYRPFRLRLFEGYGIAEELSIYKFYTTLYGLYTTEFTLEWTIPSITHFGVLGICWQARRRLDSRAITRLLDEEKKSLNIIHTISTNEKLLCDNGESVW